jgi:hypothetical protein
MIPGMPREPIQGYAQVEFSMPLERLQLEAVPSTADHLPANTAAVVNRGESTSRLGPALLRLVAHGSGAGQEQPSVAKHAGAWHPAFCIEFCLP